MNLIQALVIKKPFLSSYYHPVQHPKDVEVNVSWFQSVYKHLVDFLVYPKFDQPYDLGDITLDHTLYRRQSNHRALQTWNKIFITRIHYKIYLEWILIRFETHNFSFDWSNNFICLWIFFVSSRYTRSDFDFLVQFENTMNKWTTTDTSS